MSFKKARITETQWDETKVDYLHDAHHFCRPFPFRAKIDEWTMRWIFTKSPLVRVVAEIKNVRDHPRLMIIITSGFVELILNEIIKRRCKRPSQIVKQRDYPLSVQILLLHEMGILSDHNFEILNWLRKLRNEAAHEWEFSVSRDVLTSMFAENENHDPAHLYSVCHWILMDLFLEFTGDIGAEVIHPSFIPDPQKAASVVRPPYEYALVIRSDKRGSTNS